MLRTIAIFYPIIDRIKNIIDSGEIGNPVMTQINAFEWFDPSVDEPRYWLLKRELAGGGPMFDFGCHRIEVLINLFGEVENVEAITSNVFSAPRSGGYGDSAISLFPGHDRNPVSVSRCARASGHLDVFASRGSIHVPV